MYVCNPVLQVTTDYIKSLKLTTHPLSSLSIREETDICEYGGFSSIKEEISDFNDDFIWRDGSSDEEPLSKKVKEKNKEEATDVKIEKDDLADCRNNDDGIFDNHSQQNDIEVDLYIFTKEQQLEEIQARKTSSNYLNSLYKCDKCFKGFMTENTYNNHMTRHDPVSGIFIVKLSSSYTYPTKWGRYNMFFIML
jgi:hypothetical protein